MTSKSLIDSQHKIDPAENLSEDATELEEADITNLPLLCVSMLRMEKKDGMNNSISSIESTKRFPEGKFNWALPTLSPISVSP